MNKTTYENEVEIRYDDGIECETFRMDTVDFGTFLAPLNENIGIVLRDRKNYRNGILTIPDQRTYHSFLEELTYQRINVMRNETTGVAYLSFSKAKKEIHVKYDEKNITRYTLQEKAFLALKEAVREVVKRHQETKRPLAVWQNGRVVLVPADKFSSNNGK